MIDRRLIRNIDLELLLLLLIICTVGMLTLYSATHLMDDLADPFQYVKRYAIFFGLGIACMTALCFIDYINFVDWVRYVYIANLGLLLLILFLGREDLERRGSIRWISIGFFDLQPSEIAKVILIIALAKLLSEKEGKFNSFYDILPALVVTAVPMALIFLQPDLGTALVFIAVLVGMLYVSGLHRRFLLPICLTGLTAAPLIWLFLLKDYHKDRLMVFLNPEIDPTGTGWQLIQSMIGIGSGGPFGKGFLESTQVRLQFLPDHHTDFIFSVLGEEWGFVGAAGLLLVYFLLIYRILWIGTHAKDQLGALLCFGVAIMFAFQILVNVGMTIRIMPVTGLPLPFMSYGNNALLVNLISIGLVLNVAMRRNKIQF